MSDADWLRSLCVWPHCVCVVVQSQDCVFEYKEIASRYGLSMAQLALGWTYSRPFVTSTLIGATSMNQVRSQGKRDRGVLAFVLEGGSMVARRRQFLDRNSRAQP